MSQLLTYDNLPPHSRLIREMGRDTLTLTARPEEPGPFLRKTLLRRAAVKSAGISAVVIALLLLIFGRMYLDHRRGMSASISLMLEVAFIIFCIAAYALAWRVHYSKLLDDWGKLLQQTTIVAASPGRLFIETSGPLGAASHQIYSDSPAGVDRLEISQLKDHPGISCLDIVRKDGTRTQILPARDETELRWVAHVLSTAIQI